MTASVILNHMTRLNTCIAISIIFHAVIIIPLYLTSKHGYLSLPNVINVSLFEKAFNSPFEAKDNDAEKNNEFSHPKNSEPDFEMTAKSVPELEDSREQEDIISYESSAKVDPSYHGKMKAKIFSMYSYPQEAIDKGIEGKVLIGFTIESSGQASSIRVKRSSGHQILDNASLKAVKDASPFQPPESSLEMDATFLYVIE